MTGVGEYLKWFAMQRFKWWLEADCCELIAQWCVRQGYPDPMGNLRGAYSSEAEARVLIEEAGGMGPLLHARLTAAGLKQVKRADAQEGDIGVCTVPGESGAMTDIAALWTGRRWVFLSERGLIGLEPSLVKVRGRWR